MERKTLLALSAFFIILGSTLGGYFYFNPIFYEEREPKRFFWISGLFIEESVAIVKENPDQIDMVSPTYYSIAPNGSLIHNYRENSEYMCSI